jgi:hypothetical protein
MSVLVDDKPIEIVLRYVDKQFSGGAVGAVAFTTNEEESDWVEKENKRRAEKAMELKALGEEVPEKLERDASEDVKKIVTFWKRMDWGTQAKILDDSAVKNDLGEISTDWSKYRMSQMNNLMVGWDLKSGGKPIPITEKVVKRMDFVIAISLLNKYEKVVSADEEEMENLD